MPQMILKNFTNERGKLWCFNKDTGRCYQVPPSKVLVERDFYSAVLVDGSKDAFAEMKLAEGIEAETAPLVCRLIRCARGERELDISYEEKKILALFVHIQDARTRMSYNISRNDKILAAAVRQWEARGNCLTGEQRKILNDEGARGRIKKHLWLRYLTDEELGDEETISKLMGKEIGVMFIQKPNKSFIIGDHPVIRGVNKRGNIRLDDGVFEMLPVAHDVLLFWGREYYGDQERIIVQDSHKIRSINEAILRRSTTICGRSQDLVRSLSRSKAARERPVIRKYSMNDFLSELEETPAP